MRLIAAALVLLLAFGPSLAEKKKQALLEECVPVVEFVQKLPEDGVFECGDWQRKEMRAWRKHWSAISEGSVGDRRYEVLGVGFQQVWSKDKDDRLEFEIRENACKRGGDAILEWRVVCVASDAASVYTYKIKAIVGVVIKWIDEEEQE